MGEEGRSLGVDQGAPEVGAGSVNPEGIKKETGEAIGQMLDVIRQKNDQLGGFFADIGKTSQGDSMGDRTIAVFGAEPNSPRWGVDSELGRVRIHPHFAAEIVLQKGNLTAAFETVDRKHEGLPYAVQRLDEVDASITNPAALWADAVHGAKRFAESKIEADYTSKLEDAKRGLAVLQQI